MNFYLDRDQDRDGTDSGTQDHINGLESSFNRSSKRDELGTIYKVIAGSFSAKENAQERAANLNVKGIASFIAFITISGQDWFRVQAGVFSSRENAEKRLNEVKQAGFDDAYILTEQNSFDKEEPLKYSIFGPNFLSSEDMNLFVRTINPEAMELGSYYQSLGEYYGIRGDIAFAQAMLETDYLRFTGVVQSAQNNFCGLGTTGPDHPGESFASPRDGVLAHLQHLYAYATTKLLPEKYPLVDPRFNYVQRGSAPTWIELNGKWAVPGENYGQSILNIYERMISKI